MSLQKRSFWKILFTVLCLLLPVAAWLIFGEQGLVHLYRSELERQACIDRIRKLADENQALIEEIKRLRTDMKHVESIARREFNLIKKNEVIYRFGNQKSYDYPLTPGSSGPAKAVNKESKREQTNAE